jgi:O-antigen ligase
VYQGVSSPWPEARVGIAFWIRLDGTPVAGTDGDPLSGLLWTVIVWGLGLVVATALGRRGRLKGRVFRLSRAQLAIAIVLLGTHTLAASETAEEILQDPVVLERVVRLGLVGLALLVILPSFVSRMHSAQHRAFPGLTAISLYWAIAALSILYSVAPVVSLGKVIELAAGVVIVWTIALGPNAEGELRRTIQFVVWLEAILVGGAVVGFVILPEFFSFVSPRPGFVFEQTMTARYAAPNALSAAGGLVAAYSLAMVFRYVDKRSKLGWSVIFVIGTAGTILASGRQGVVIWLASVMILLLLHRRRAFVLLVIPAVGIILGTYGSAIWTALVRARPANIVNLSGRVGYWQAAINAWLGHPMTGYGYGAGGRFVALTAIGDSTTSNVHNGYIEALVGLGILGVIPLALAAWRVLVWSARRLKARADTHIAILIVPLLLHTLVSQGFGAWLNEDFMLFTLLAGMVAISSRRPRSRPLRVSADSGVGT